MYAVIECGGKQYRVQEGDRVRVEKLPNVVGESVTLDKVLLIGGEQTVIGNPLVEGARVTATVLNQDKEKKVLVFRYKAKKNVRVRYGHRQPFTNLLIEKILKDGAKDEPAKAPAAKAAAKAEQAAAVETAEAAPAKPKATRTRAAKPASESGGEAVAEKKPRTRAKKTETPEA
jgi:large subunit ribosomal protein L21